MKILHINRTDCGTGAARAAYRIHCALRMSGFDSIMWVCHSGSSDWTVGSPLSKFEQFLARLSPHVANFLGRCLRTDNEIMHSFGLFSSPWIKHINCSDVDIIHLHWVGAEMLSIPDISRIKKPVVWTFHDMWGFCGAEHISFDDRWRKGYNSQNRSINERGPDLNRWTWERKRKYWKKPIHIVTPSSWLSSCVRQSALMRDWPVKVVPNCLDTERWQPIDQKLARHLLNLPLDVPMLAFGANGARVNSSFHKGFDLLVGALKCLRQQVDDLEILIFGELTPEREPAFGFPVHYLGYLNDDISLRCLFSSADVLVVPSRAEAFCQVASEAHACGTPVAAFDIGGLKDVILHRYTGYLAEPFNVNDLASGIAWLLKNDLGDACRRHAVETFSINPIAKAYVEIYQEVICSKN